MPPIVADTTPLNYLVLIEAIEILPQLYGRVLIPHPYLPSSLIPMLLTRSALGPCNLATGWACQSLGFKGCGF